MLSLWILGQFFAFQVILSLTSLSEVQFYEDHSKFLQRTKVLPLSLNFLMEAMMNENVNIQVKSTFFDLLK